MTEADPQNRPKNLRYLAASQDYFDRAGMWRRSQLTFIVALPTGLALWGASQPSLNFIVSFVGFFAALLDAAVFGPAISRNRYWAAQLAECYDACIFGGSPSEVRCWPRPSEEDVQAAANHRLRRAGASEDLRTWYTSRMVMLIPVAAHLLCHRISCSWDEQLRSKYVAILVSTAVVTVLALLLITGEVGWDLPRLVINVLFPIVPAAVWFCRELIDQREARQRKEHLRHAIERIWSRLMQLGATSDIEREREAVQGMHFMFRATQTSVPNWLHRSNRQRQREVSRVTIDAYVDEAVNRNFGSTPGPHGRPTTYQEE